MVGDAFELCSQGRGKYAHGAPCTHDLVALNGVRGLIESIQEVWIRRIQKTVNHYRVIYEDGEYGRYGYRRITALLRREGFQVNYKRVERLWRREGLKVPQKQPKRKRLWFNDGSCIRLRPQFKDHVWSYDFVATRTEDGRSLRILTLLDEYTRECLALKVARRGPRSPSGPCRAG